MWDPQSVEGRRRITAAAIVAVATVCWLLPIGHPLSLDETGTYWVVKDGALAAMQRAYYWTNWSPYYALESVVVRIGGRNEIVMRLPSVLAMGVAAAFLYRIGARVWDEEAGLLAALVFAGMPDVAYAAADARPYALTLMALCGYAWALLRWIDTNRLRDAAATVIFAVLAAYGHTILALGIVAPALYAIWRTRKPLPLIAMALCAGVLLIPLAVQTRDYLAMNTNHVIGGVPTLDDLWSAIAPPQLFATVGLGVLLAFGMVSAVRAGWDVSRSATFALAGWIVLGPAVLFVLGRMTPFRLFIPRYLVADAVPLALLFGCLIRAIEPVRARRLVVVTIAIVSSLTFTLSAKAFHGGGLRDAMAAVRQEVQGRDIPVLVSSSFIEAQQPENLVDPRLKDALFAPEFFYPSAGHVVHLLYRFDEAFLNQIVQTELAGRSEFLVLTYNDATSTWFRNRAPALGYEPQFVGDFRGLELYRYVKR